MKYVTRWQCVVVAILALCVGAARGAETVHIESPDRKLEEIAAAAEEFLALSDGAPLAAEEMAAYWRLFRWSRESDFETLQKQARSDVLYTQLRQNPSAYRGKLLKLKLNVRRALRHDAPVNRAGIVQVYEGSGSTAESSPYPYIITFADPPAEFPLGATVDVEVEFVGYFLKSMGYEANGKKLAAPLLIGRARWVPAQHAAAQGWENSEWLGRGLFLVATVCLYYLVRQFWRRPSRRRSFREVVRTHDDVRIDLTSDDRAVEA